jgi:predicted RNA-binding Zn-ribbon protein involved in translation (DUF1610 family)
MTDSTATPTRTRLTPVQRDRLTAAAAHGEGFLATDTATRTADVLTAAGLVERVPAFDRPSAPTRLRITDAGRAAVGAPVPAEAEAAPVACPFCGAATVAPDPSRPEEEGHYCERCGRVASESAERPAPSMAAAQGEPVTQRHADYCAEHGHATHTVDGAETGVCPRCGDVTVPAEDGPTVETLFVHNVRAGHVLTNRISGRDLMVVGTDVEDVPGYVLVVPADDRQAEPFTVQADEGTGYAFVLVGAQPVAYPGTAEPVDAEPDAEPVDAATRAYLTTALWSSLNDDGEPLDGAYLVSDIADETAAQARRDVADFLTVVGAGDVAAYVAAFGGDAGQIGHDLWLTRNGHGAGFSDRGLGDLGDRLTLWADALGTVDLYVGDDGKIHGA